MSFRVVVTRTAARQLAEHLPEAVAAACVEFIFGALERIRTGSALSFGGHSRVSGGPGVASTGFGIGSMNPVRSSTWSTWTTVGTPTEADLRLDREDRRAGQEARARRSETRDPSPGTGIRRPRETRGNDASWRLSHSRPSLPGGFDPTIARLPSDSIAR